MIIYFAIEQCLIDEYGLSETETSGQYNWDLNHNSFIFSYIGISAGKVLDTIKKYHKEYPDSAESFAICKAEVDYKDAVEALRSALVGDSINVKVTILEMTWIK